MANSGLSLLVCFCGLLMKPLGPTEENVTSSVAQKRQQQYHQQQTATTACDTNTDDILEGLHLTTQMEFSNEIEEKQYHEDTGCGINTQATLDSYFVGWFSVRGKKITESWNIFLGAPVISSGNL